MIQDGETVEDGNRIPRRVAIRGEWNVQAKDILGQPTMYGIPALVAVEVPAEKEKSSYPGL